MTYRIEWRGGAAALLMIACCGCEDGTSPSTEEVVGGAVRVAGRTPSRSRSRARACRADELFLDIPLYTSPPWTDTTFTSGIASALESAAAAGGWFCEGAVCPTEAVGVEVVSVLADRTGYAPRDDGHLRFFRFQFVGVSTGARYRLTEAGACQAVERLRIEIDNLGVPPEGFYVGRECDTSVMSLQSSPTLDMLARHTRALGLRDSVLTVGQGPSNANVELALVDTGVHPGVAAALGIVSTATAPPARPHEHATGMAILARQLAPRALITDRRALDSGGSGTSGAVARAIDDTIFENPGSTSPLVINLSLGAPPELARHTILSSGSCATYEDPFGESVRYVLDVARRLDVEQRRPIFVSTAAGNRPLPVDPAIFPPSPTNPQLHLCSFQSATPEWFFPAQWHRVDSCRDSVPGNIRLAFATSAVDDLYRPSIIGIEGAESPLVAPGSLVVVDHPAAMPVSAQCTTGPTGYAPVTLPATFTGSSVSAALTAAAAARAQQMLIDNGIEPLDRDALARLLYATGVDLCRPSITGASVRRLHVGRLDRTITSCREVVRCVRALGGDEPVPSSTVQSCIAELAECGFERMVGGIWSPVCPSPAGTPASLPPGDLGASCVLSEGTASPLLPSACGSSCPDALAVDRYSVGTLGPQPSAGGCPHCKAHVFLVNPNEVEIIVYADLNPDLPLGTTMTSPWLRVHDANKKLFVDLAALSSGDWTPGQNRKIAIRMNASGIDWSESQAELLIDIQSPDAKFPTTDVSVLEREGP